LYKGDMYQRSRESSKQWIWIWPLNQIRKKLYYF
jgi:hypothetical protein